MRRRLTSSIAALCFALEAMATVGSAQTVDPASDLGHFRALRAAGMWALERGDTATALDQFGQAQALMPDSPSIALLKAQVYLQQKRKADAKAALADYLRRGNVLDLAKNAEFNAVWDSELENQLQLNVLPVGKMRVAAQISDFSIAEALAFNPDGEQSFVSAVRSGQILSLSPEGVRSVITFRPGVAAYGLGMREGKLWATTAQSRQTVTYDPKKPATSKIVTIDPADGSVLASVDTTADRRLGHLLMGRDDLYVIDSNHGSVLRLTGYGKTLEELVPEGYMDTPTGLAENESASVLIVNDFVSGLYRVDLSTGGMSRLLAPRDGNLLGITSIARYGNDLIAIQSGVEPNRLLRVHMTPDWTAVQSVDVLLRSKDMLSQPSQGVVSDNAFVFVARSQWDNLDNQGNSKTPTPPPGVVGVIDLAQ
ncbi:tetratricopeptide repeat protein [Asticcacaulis sp. 201]|uniref:tetratricopeptide repeat protein n=1 Tax=Asticcacaulis sp. 201 TaxID=3028787 RepID=UPI002915D954|nr:tetratricopeptide repeat protein [Asticcacaulis sp. 201]MDV6331831.1 tetratricopeptide repeat protein [Asticcacaulis sp. 201]